MASLIAATRHLEVPHILVLRRLTLRDPEARKWANEKQLNIVFQVILSKAIERYGLPKLKAARDRGFEPLLPAGGDSRDEDLRVLGDIATQLIGPPQMSEAESTQASFHALLARGAAVPPPRTMRTQPPTREPPPLFAAQLGPAGDKQLRRMIQVQQSEDEGGGERTPFTDFTTLFDDTICGYTEKTLAMFRISGPSRGLRLPFLLAPEFGPVYREVLKKHILPQMRATRAIQALGGTYNWAEVGGERLIEIIQGSEVNNPILHNWDGRWASFRAPKAPKGKKAPPPKPEDNPWPLFRDDATRCNYEPPSEAHVILLQDIIRFEADVMAKCWRELSQLYTQEFAPSGRMDQAREGAFRDGIMKWSAKLPDYIGEHLAMKAHFEFERLDADWMRKLLNNFGKNDSERRRNAPFLSDFVLQLGY
ncbi:hypothetical protein [Paramagnetospirillum marisnigri]|uniref:hypothetical protein n=1 Tax=Paramagnetospirillum marisnigri TaxID=1285242 RepID=UPI001FDECED8|nr:hypothetical protein [Paramagnetospirillum marisnigri]